MHARKTSSKPQEDPRRLVLIRRRKDTDPTRVYAGRIPASLPAGAVAARFRQRWQHQERVIRQMVNGTNLNDNFYTYSEVPTVPRDGAGRKRKRKLR